MRLFIIAMMGFACIGMTVLALANPGMLPKHPGYPASGEFANDTGQENLTYNQSIQEAAKSGDTTMGMKLTDPKPTGILDLKFGDPSKHAGEQPVKLGVPIPKK